MNIAAHIGNTPLIKLASFSNQQRHIYAKLEGQNISGSIKDRVALAMVEDLEERAILTPQSILFEPSSGNTGIGLAMIGVAKGYPVSILMPENATPERISMLKMFGAEVLFCSKEEWAGEAAILRAKSLTEENPRFVMPNQYENPVCVDIHYQTTAAEILSQCPDITHLIATIGTGGTITGIAKRLKEHNPLIKIIGVEIPSDSKIPGPRSLQGYIPKILDFSYIDERFMIQDESEVFSLWKRLAQTEGIFYGLSSAAALSVALQISATSSTRPAHVVVIFPDRGEKYVSILETL